MGRARRGVRPPLPVPLGRRAEAPGGPPLVRALGAGVHADGLPALLSPLTCPALSLWDSGTGSAATPEREPCAGPRRSPRPRAPAQLAGDPRAGGSLSAFGHRPGRVAARFVCRPPPPGR